MKLGRTLGPGARASIRFRPKDEDLVYHTEPMSYRTHSLASLAVIASVSFCGCKDEPAASTKPVPSATAQPSATASASAPAKESDWTTSPVDPVHGKFTLEEATAGLPGSGKLLADLDTVAGKLTCELYDDKAPLSVANFVGLARGLRPYKGPDGKWVKQPAFDGNQFHRTIKKFMIQGGAPRPDGGGDGGYYFEDELWPGMTHDRAGLLCMANSGPNTNSMQFFILDDEAKYLDKRGHTIFGDCKPLGVIHKLASAKTDKKDHPTAPQTIKTIAIRRASAK